MSVHIDKTKQQEKLGDIKICITVSEWICIDFQYDIQYDECGNIVHLRPGY